MLTSLHGPASDYMKKLFANFGFPNLSTTETQSQMSVDFVTVPLPSTQLHKLALKQSFLHAGARDSKFIICTDLIGESILVAEQ